MNSAAIIAPGGNDDPTLVDMDDTELKFYREKNMPVAAFASQAKGFFSKIEKSGESGLFEKVKKRYFCDENIRRYEIIKSLAKDRKRTVGAVVCGVMCNLNGIFPIIGCSNPEQICDSMYGTKLKFAKEEIKIIFKKND